ncbi:hypothetical protein D3C72_1857340 [compost metagenome]
MTAIFSEYRLQTCFQIDFFDVFHKINLKSIFAILIVIILIDTIRRVGQSILKIGYAIDRIIVVVESVRECQELAFIIFETDLVIRRSFESSSVAVRIIVGIVILHENILLKKF